jgi:excisionase family DNA binding protein
MDDRQLKLSFLYRVEETIDSHTAARVARVSESTIRRWCDMGEIPAYKMVGRWRINRAKFIEWLEAFTRDR